MPLGGSITWSDMRIDNKEVYLKWILSWQRQLWELKLERKLRIIVLIRMLNSDNSLWSQPLVVLYGTCAHAHVFQNAWQAQISLHMLWFWGGQLMTCNYSAVHKSKLIPEAFSHIPSTPLLCSCAQKKQYPYSWLGFNFVRERVFQ